MGARLPILEDGTGSAHTCPSGPAVDGALLLGVVREDGHVAFLGTPLPVNQDFIDRAKVHGAPERRFRFAAPCQETGCAQWSKGRCGVGDKATRLLEASADEIRACAIRDTCRWWSQHGATACRVCDQVITDTRLSS